MPRRPSLAKLLVILMVVMALQGLMTISLGSKSLDTTTTAVESTTRLRIEAPFKALHLKQQTPRTARRIPIGGDGSKTATRGHIGNRKRDQQRKYRHGRRGRTVEEPIVMMHPNATAGNPCGRTGGDAEHHHESFSPNHKDDCSHYKLPFTTSVVPAKCWPQIVLLPSYPTGGNELVHGMFEQLTGLVTVNTHEGNVLFKLTITDSASDEPKIDIQYPMKKYCNESSSSLSSSLQLPIAGRVALTKTHFRYSLNVDPNKFVMTRAQQSNEVGGGIIGIVRLARNPGDHLLRNVFWWRHLECSKAAAANNNNTECFFQQAASSCALLTRAAAQDWNSFHEYWNQYPQNTTTMIPQIVLYYERFTQKTTAPASFRALLDFVGESVPASLPQQVEAYVREPTYAQGSLVAQVCGVAKARELHEETKEYSKRLGYEFNIQTGVWTLAPNVPIQGQYK